MENVAVDTITFDGQVQKAVIRANTRSIELIKDKLVKKQTKVFDSKGLSTIRDPAANESPSKESTLRATKPASLINANSAELKEIHIVAATRADLGKNLDSEIKNTRLNTIKFKRTHNRKFAQTPEQGLRKRTSR